MTNNVRRSRLGLAAATVAFAGALGCASQTSAAQQATSDPATATASCAALLPRYQPLTTVPIARDAGLRWYRAFTTSEVQFVADPIDFDSDGKKEVVAVAKIYGPGMNRLESSVIYSASLDPLIRPADSAGTIDAANAMLAAKGDVAESDFSNMDRNLQLHSTSPLPDLGDAFVELGSLDGNVVVLANALDGGEIIDHATGKTFSEHKDPKKWRVLLRFRSKTAADVLCADRS